MLYPILFLAARTATCWASRRLLSSPAQRSVEGGSEAWQCTAAGSSSALDEELQPALPAELLPLQRGAWANKLPSACSGAALPFRSAGAAATAPAADKGDGSPACSGGGACSECRHHGRAAAAGCGGGNAARQRFFQLSADGAALRWSWDRWILMPHVQAIHCW